ncbi:MAG: hypothetical protein MZV64_27960 [Ignavibacteriales bacterium]|nr:hypothetical protein [Ignavibacteriales bacterium]
MRMSCSSDRAWITRARAEEEQRLEEGVGHQVEDAGRRTRPRRRPGTCSPSWLDGRVGEHALDVVLGQARWWRRRAR